MGGQSNNPLPPLTVSQSGTRCRAVSPLKFFTTIHTADRLLSIEIWHQSKTYHSVETHPQNTVVSCQNISSNRWTWPTELNLSYKLRTSLRHSVYRFRPWNVGCTMQSRARTTSRYRSVAFREGGSLGARPRLKTS